MACESPEGETIMVLSFDRGRGHSVAVRTRGYTLVEVLVMVTIMGLLGAMVVPSLSVADGMRAQAAVRTVVSDITFVQTDAMAFQRGRAIIFDVTNNSYKVVEVTGATLDPVNDLFADTSRPGGFLVQSFDDADFGGAAFSSVSFDGGDTLIFDEMGAPVTTPGGTTPSSGGRIEMTGKDASYWIEVDGFTGHITTGKM